MGQSNIKDLGACQILFDDVDLGKSFGDVIFKSAVSSEEIHEDQAGTTPVDEVMTGRMCSVDVPMTRTSLDQLAKVIPNASVVGGALIVKNPVGTTLADKAKELILKPIVDNVPSVDSTTWLTVFLCAPRENLEITYNNASQRVFGVTFVAFPVTTSPDTGNLWKIG